MRSFLIVVSSGVMLTIGSIAAAQTEPVTGPKPCNPPCAGTIQCPSRHSICCCDARGGPGGAPLPFCSTPGDACPPGT